MKYILSCIFSKNLLGFYIAILFPVFLPSCTFLRPISEPIERITRTGSCIAFDIPPITLTPTKTAAERQLLGEGAVIEPEGWMIVSAQTTAKNRKSFSKSPLNSIGTQKEKRRYYVELGVLRYYSDTVIQYRNQQIIGESYTGKLKLVPFSVSKKGGSAQRKIALEILNEVNLARVWLYRYALKKVNKKNSRELRQIQYKYLNFYFFRAKKNSGEWVFTMKKKWKRIP